jgi:hypothetical protein
VLDGVCTGEMRWKGGINVSGESKAFLRLGGCTASLSVSTARPTDAAPGAHASTLACGQRQRTFLSIHLVFGIVKGDTSTGGD